MPARATIDGKNRRVSRETSVVRDARRERFRVVVRSNVRAEDVSRARGGVHSRDIRVAAAARARVRS